MKMLKNLVILLFVLLIISCNDKWDNHITLNKDVSNQTIIEMIQNNPDLSEFLKYLQKSGLDKELSTSKLYTVWVPDNIAMATVDPSIYNDSAKLNMFVANHIAMNEYYIQNQQGTISIKTLNKKNIEFIISDSIIDGVKISKVDIFVKNGVVHIIPKPLNPRLNIWEYISTMADENEHVAYMKSLSGTRFVPNPIYQTGFNSKGKPVYDTVKCTIWYNQYFEKVTDLRAEDSVFTFFIVDNSVFDNEYERFKKYFWVENGQTASDTAMVKYKVTKDYVFSGAYTHPGIPDTLVSLSGVKVPYDASATLLYRASNGYIFKVNNCAVRLIDKIPPIIIEGETADKYLLPKITVSGSNKRYKPSARGGYDFILDNHGQAAAEYDDGTANPNAGGIALHVKEIASVKYKISWKTVNDFRGGLTTQDTLLVIRQKLAFSQINRIIAGQPEWLPASILTSSYDTVKNNSYPGTEKELVKWTFSRMRNDVYFEVLCGKSTYRYVNASGITVTVSKVGPVTIDYLKLEPIFE